jgi:hypothetical protein
MGSPLGVHGASGVLPGQVTGSKFGGFSVWYGKKTSYSQPSAADGLKKSKSKSIAKDFVHLIV